MTFKKIDVDEIKFSMYENLIGLPYVDKKEEEKYEDKQLGLSKSFKSSKKEGLTIPITFRRTELFEGNIKGDISGNLSEDSLIIRNISDRDKLWNLKVNLEEISKNIFITEIPPSQEWTQKIKESKEGFAPKLKVYEKISRKDYISDLGEESQLFLEKNGENEIYGNIVLHNKSKDRLTDIVLTKYFPRTLLELLEVKHNSGTVDKNIKRLKWTISNLNPEKELSLRYKIKLSPKPTQSGKIDIQYRVNVGGNDLYNIDDFDSSIKVAEFVHINEKDEKPGFWDCSLTLINRSSYKVNLIGAELTQDTDEGTERHFSLKNSDISIKPYEEKTLFSKTIESENRPILKKKIKYSPDRRVINDFSAKMVLDEENIELLNIKAEKKFDKTELKSFEIDSVNENLTLMNYSTLPINHMLVKEELPEKFKINDIREIKIKSKDKVLSYGEFLDENDIMTREQELKKIEEDLTKIQNNYQGVREKVVAKKKQMKELQEKLENVEFSQLKDDLYEKKKKKEELKESIQKNKDQQKSLKKELNNQKETKKRVEKQIKSLKEDQSKAKDLENLKEKIGSHEKRENKINTKHKKIKSQISSLEKDLKDLEKQEKELKEKKNGGESSEKEEIASKQKEIQAKMDKIKTKQDSLQKELESIEKEKKKIKSKLENFNKKQKALKGKIKTQNENSDEIQKELNISEKKLKDIKNEIQVLKNKINSKEKSIPKLVKNLDELKHNTQKLNEKTASVEKIQDQLDDTKSKLKNYIEQAQIKMKEFNVLKEKRISLMELDHADQSIEQIFNEFYGKFSEKRTKEEPAFKIEYIEKKKNKNWLLIAVNNLNNLLTSIEGENELILDYDMSAMRPSYDHNYQFPCTIFFDTKPIKSVQKYGLSENFLPEIDIVHERHKISLGKIVDHYTKAGQFQIMLLVRNNGDKYIYDLDLIDNLPRTAEIHNAGFEYEENIIDEKMKEIIWKIEKIGPREEIEVSYLLNVPEGDYDLQNHEIFIK